MCNPRIHKLYVALAMIAGAGVSMSALSQAPGPQARERVEVTGSNIKRIEGETALPVTVITRGDIERMGATDTEDILKRITASTAIYSETTQGVGYAVSNANMRGLGASSTLVLLNGRRLANHAFGSIGGFNASASAVDLNSIPFSAIERVEVLRDGASAVYGTDAVGGVINFITRSDYRGAEIQVMYGNTEDNIGGAEQSARVAYGVGDLAKDGWNLLFTGHFEYKERVKAIDQKLYARADNIEGASFPTSFRAFPGRLMDYGFSPGAYAGTLTSDPSIAGCDPNFTVLQVSGTTPSGDPRIRCRGIYAAYLDNLPDNHKADVFGRFTYDLSPQHQYFLEASYARNHNIGRIAPVPIDQTAAHIRPDGTQPNILLPLTSRYAPIALLNRLGYSTADVGTPGYLEIAVRSADAGNRINDVTAEQQRLSTGLKGVLGGWDYDAAFTYAESKDKLAVTGYIQEQRYIAALATGDLNPFGANDAAGAALLNGAKMEGDMRKSTNKETQVDGKMSRDLFRMAGGNAAIAVGADFRREEIDDNAVNADYGAGLNIGGEGTVPHTSASRNVSALFTELSLPLLANLEVTGAARYDHYSDVGSKTSPQVRARYNPVHELLLRASAGKGFRAPSLWDLKSPPNFGNSANSLTDPGCPPQLLADEDARCVDTQLNVRNIASPNLKPETSTQWSAGFVFEPTQRTSIALDYWNIEKKDTIGSVTADAILADPSNLTLYNQFINRFVRSAAGTTLYVDQPLENLGTLKTSGWDVDARMRFTPTFGRVTLSFMGTYVTKYEQQLGQGFPTVSYLGNSFNGGNAYPRWQHVASIDVEHGPWLGTIEQTFTAGWTEAFLAGGTHEIPSTSRINLAGTYSGIKHVKLKVGVRNALDDLPPYTDVSSNGSHAAGWANAVADPRGRFWYTVATFTF
ncbi:MAG TPA: TonB-dependent receptor [Usitatibacter sp.]|jgi:iron complex outermembrane receptor protein|nr:TonB-dependent receptor [Usitatibacter sp.]